MIEIIAQNLLFIVSNFAVFCYVCRLSQMSWKTTKPSPLIMHLSFAIATVWAGYHGWFGVADLGDFCTVLGAIAWISISYKTWRHGVPEHFSKPMELDEMNWGTVRERRK